MQIFGLWEDRGGRQLELLKTRTIAGLLRAWPPFLFLQVKGSSMIEDHIIDWGFCRCEQTQVAMGGTS